MELFCGVMETEETTSLEQSRALLLLCDGWASFCKKGRRSQCLQKQAETLEAHMTDRKELTLG